MYSSLYCYLNPISVNNLFPFSFILRIQLRNQNSVDCLVAHAGVAVLPLHVLCVSFPFVLSLMSLVRSY